MHITFLRQLLITMLLLALIQNCSGALAESTATTVPAKLLANMPASNEIKLSVPDIAEGTTEFDALFDENQAIIDTLSSFKQPSNSTVPFSSRASTIERSIWNTSLTVTMPGNSYFYNQNDSLIAYFCPTQDILVGFAKYSYQSSLSTWKAIMEKSGRTCGYQSINGLSTVYGIYVDSDGYDITFYVNHGRYSYSLLTVNATYESASYFIESIVETLQLSAVDYNIWGSGAYITLPRGSYEYSNDSDLVTWYCPNEGILIGFARYPKSSLAYWHRILDTEVSTTSLDTINSTPIALGYGEMAEDDGYYRLTCFFNYKNYSYCIMAAGMDYDQLEIMYGDILYELFVPYVPIPDPSFASDDMLELPTNLTFIEDQAFMSSSAVNVVIPNGCISIGAAAFADCTELQYIVIPESVKSIADDAFSGCDRLSIYAPTRSYAAAYAEFSGINWIESP